MSIELDESLITKFRDKANQNPVFRNAYKNIDGRNKWNIICSAMDWITVTSRGIKYIKFKEHGGLGVDDYGSLTLMQYIVTVDVMVEAIIQLYRVLTGVNSKYPLHSDNSIFGLSISDDKYFKHLRAAFSTHPINLDSLDGTLTNSDERYYASWSSRVTLNNDDFVVYLYSNNPNKTEMYELGVKLDNINSYCKKRYELLNDLHNKVEAITEEIVNKFRLKPIPMSNNPLEQVELLILENSKRIGATYGYHDYLCYLREALKVSENYNIDDPIVKRYLEFLINHLPAIILDMQNMTFNMEINMRSLIWDYETEKIYAYLLHGHPYGEHCFKELISKGFLPRHLLKIVDKSLYILFLDSYLYKQSDELRKKVSIKELLSL